MAPKGELNEIKNLTHRLYSARQFFVRRICGEQPSNKGEQPYLKMR